MFNIPCFPLLFPLLSPLTTFSLRVGPGSSPWACLWHFCSFRPLLVFVFSVPMAKQYGQLAYYYTADWMDPIIHPSLTLFTPCRPLFVCKQKVKNHPYVGQENCVEHLCMRVKISTGGSVCGKIQDRNVFFLFRGGTDHGPSSFFFLFTPPLVSFPFAAGLCFSPSCTPPPPSLLPAPSLLLARAHPLSLHLFVSPSKIDLFQWTCFLPKLSPQVHPSSSASKNRFSYYQVAISLRYHTFFFFALSPQKRCWLSFRLLFYQLFI